VTAAAAAKWAGISFSFSSWLAVANLCGTPIREKAAGKKVADQAGVPRSDRPPDQICHRRLGTRARSNRSPGIDALKRNSKILNIGIDDTLASQSAINACRDSTARPLSDSFRVGKRHRRATREPLRAATGLPASDRKWSTSTTAWANACANLDRPRVGRTFNLAFLSPAITRAIVRGGQPPGLRLPTC
jgi:hypothetical protein